MSDDEQQTEPREPVAAETSDERATPPDDAPVDATSTEAGGGAARPRTRRDEAQQRRDAAEAERQQAEADYRARHGRA